jgi:diadenosine tetraphosphatase ApaH/serine/threonine PP2A family protein phosphatase
MLIAILSDIHGNREAFDAAMKAAAARGAGRYVLLGDLVGYGPDPAHLIERAEELRQRGAVVIRGNHDEAVLSGPHGMNEIAREALNWTVGQLSPAHADFLRTLPLTASEDDRLYVHDSAHEPGRWHYVDDIEGAARCLAASEARTVFCGHTHIPAIFYALPGKTPVHFRPLDNVAAPLSAVRRQVVVVGAVGQPRDGNPAACFALLDTRERSVTMVRVPYDVERTARKIEAAGLPLWLGLRLAVGR